jgi:hypothetical protein
MQTTPRFDHDCINPGCCTFAGRTLRCDVYTHRSMLGERGLIMRASSDGPDYRSWPSLRYAEMSARDDAEVFHALELVRALGSK